MEVSDKVYKEETPSKITTRADANRFSHDRKHKGGEAAFPANPEKSRAAAWKKSYIVHPNNAPTGGKTLLLNGPGHSL